MGSFEQELVKLLDYVMIYPGYILKHLKMTKDKIESMDKYQYDLIERYKLVV